MYLKKILLAFAFIVSIFSSTAWSMDDFPKEGALYRIKSQYGNDGKGINCLNSWGIDKGKGRSGVATCDHGKHASHQLWYFEKDGEYQGIKFYKIKNKHSENNLYSWGGLGKDAVGMSTFSDDGYPNGLWYFEKSGDLYRIKSFRNQFDNGDCLGFNSLCGFKCSASADTGQGTIGMQTCKAPNSHELWYLEKDEKFNPKPTLARLDKLEKFNGQLELFGSSFVSGAAYSLIPEVIRDGIEFSGYPRYANIAATVIQGGMIVCNTVSYAPIITGVAVRTGANWLGCPPQVSTILGSTAAVVASVCQSQEAALDCMTNYAIAFAGSCAGSALALQTKSWVYGLWNNSGNISKEELIVCKQGGLKPSPSGEDFSMMRHGRI